MSPSSPLLSVQILATPLMSLLSATSCRVTADYVLDCVCVSICNDFCKQYDISKTNLWIFAKFIVDTPYVILSIND